VREQTLGAEDRMERLHMNEVRELIHRLRQGQGIREVARAMRLSRNTVRKYRGVAGVRRHGTAAFFPQEVTP